MAEELDNLLEDSPGLETVFLDNAQMTVDVKLRVGVPERFMKVLKTICPEHADKVGVIPDEDGSLKMLPYPDYVKRVAFWRTLNDRIADERAVKSFETSLAKLLPLDGQNRIRLTPLHAEFCGIEKEATIVGSVDCMKLYSRHGFQQMLKRSREKYSAASDHVEREKAGADRPAPQQFVIEARPQDAR